MGQIVRFRRARKPWNRFLPTASIVAALGSFAFWWSASEGKVEQPRNADTFACPMPYHHDGDAIRCGGAGRSMRLYGIDAPEMPGACRPGRQCTPGDPYASRDHLNSLTAGRPIQCEQVDTDRYGRAVVRCWADGVDLSCRMVRDGFAIERYGRLKC
jgi:endonuclease YncB( thermonuclease family)